MRPVKNIHILGTCSLILAHQADLPKSCVSSPDLQERYSYNGLYTAENQCLWDSRETRRQTWNRSVVSRDCWHLIFLSASPELELNRMCPTT